VKGSIANQIEQAIAEAVFNDMERFGEYGFNKSHSWGYAVVAYWCAWAKYHYPLEFVAALLETNKGEAERYLREARRLGVRVLGPDVNHSQAHFVLTSEGVIRCGLLRVKYLGDPVAAHIVAHRPYDTVEDFAEKVPKGVLKKNVALGLIKVGGLDSLAQEGQMSPTRDALWRFLLARGEMVAQGTLLGGSEVSEAFEVLCDEEQIDDRARAEVEVLGSPVAMDPLSRWAALIEREERFPGRDEMRIGEIATLAAVIREARTTQTKNGDDMAIMTAERRTGAEMIAVFPEMWQKYMEKMTVGAPILVKVEKGDRGLFLRQLFRLDEI
jgi:DNA polymerase-3 subunit alpha